MTKILRTIERKAVALVAVSAALASGYVLMEISVFNKVRLNGELYKSVSEQQHLLIDSTPSPLFLVEPFYVLHVAQNSIADGRRADTLALLQRERALLDENRETRRFWSAHIPPSERVEFLRVDQTSDDLIDFIEGRVLPALDRGDALAAGELLDADGTALFERHRAAVMPLEARAREIVRGTVANAEGLALFWQRLFISTSVAALVLLPLLFFSTVRRIVVRPVRRAIVHFETIGAGDYTRPVLTRRTDEFGDMLRALERMRQSLAAAVREREQSEAHLRETTETLRISDERFALAMRGSSDGLWQWDLRTNDVYMSPRYFTMLGYEAGELPSHLDTFRELVHPDDRPGLFECIQQNINERRDEHRYEFRMRHKTGRWIPVLGRAVITFDAERAPLKMVGTTMDLTELRAAQDALRVSEERFALALQGIHEGLWDCNLVTNEVYYSPTWKHLLGYAETDIKPLLSEFDRLAHPRDRQRIQSAADRYLDGQTDKFEIQFRLRHKDGRWIEVLSRATAARDATGRPLRLIGTIIDVTERVRLEQQLADTERRYREIIDRSVRGFYQSTPDGRILSANAAMATLLGYDSPEQLTDQGQECLDRIYVNPADRQEIVRLMQAHGSVAGFETQFRRRDYQVIWISESARAVFNDDGSCNHSDNFVEDITARKEAEQLKADFVSFVTHQLRTPLSGIRWMLELAQQEGPSPEVASFITDAQHSSQRLIALVNDLLDISRLEAGRLTTSPQLVDLDALSQDVLRELQPLIASKGHLVATTGTGGCTVFVDPRLVRQAVMNLLSNAVKYTPDGGRITVCATGDDGVVRWSVTDTGIGIPAAGQQRLFEKFFRADNASALNTEGTGLGLYLVRLIAERSGGHVACESTEGAGSTFALTFPRPDRREAVA